MRIRDFAGPGGCSGVTARATDGRWVAARAALLLRVVRQLRGVEPASAVRGPAAGRARRHLGGAVAQPRQLGLVLFQYLRHGVDGRSSAWPSLLGGDRASSRSGRRRLRGAFVVLGARRGTSGAGRAAAQQPGLARPASLEPRGVRPRASSHPRECPTARVRSHAAHRALRPRRGRTRPPGPLAVRGVTLARARRRGIGGASQCPLSPIYRTPPTGRPSSAWANGQAVRNQRSTRTSTTITRRRITTTRPGVSGAVDLAPRARRPPKPRRSSVTREPLLRASKPTLRWGRPALDAYASDPRMGSRSRSGMAPMARCREALA
jgi:hypothetical protein